MFGDFFLSIIWLNYGKIANILKRPLSLTEAKVEFKFTSRQIDARVVRKLQRSQVAIA
jgi:hypothetical protein